MAKDILQYNQMVEDALRAVVQRALGEVAESGFPGNHHFYITFRTAYPGVEIPDYLRSRYATEMTIVLQHQYDDLVVDDTAFGVTLSFSNRPERLIVPLRAITVFADPSVNFALPLHAAETRRRAIFARGARISLRRRQACGRFPGRQRKTGEVVSLDLFRRK